MEGEHVAEGGLAAAYGGVAVAGGEVDEVGLAAAEAGGEVGRGEHLLEGHHVVLPEARPHERPQARALVPMAHGVDPLWQEVQVVRQHLDLEPPLRRPEDG